MAVDAYELGTLRNTGFYDLGDDTDAGRYSPISGESDGRYSPITDNSDNDEVGGNRNQRAQVTISKFIAKI